MQEYFRFICLKMMIPCISNIVDKDVKLKKIIRKSVRDICWLSIIINYFKKNNVAKEKRKEKLS